MPFFKTLEDMKRHIDMSRSRSAETVRSHTHTVPPYDHRVCTPSTDSGPTCPLPVPWCSPHRPCVTSSVPGPLPVCSLTNICPTPCCVATPMHTNVLVPHVNSFYPHHSSHFCPHPNESMDSLSRPCCTFYSGYPCTKFLHPTQYCVFCKRTYLFPELTVCTK